MRVNSRGNRIGNGQLESKTYIRRTNASFGSQPCGKWSLLDVSFQIPNGTVFEDAKM
jgi:hypothetical protein